MLLGRTLVIRMVGSMSLQQKQSEGWIKRSVSPLDEFHHGKILDAS